MKRNYKYGEMILLLREEYKECKRILDEISKYVVVSPDCTHYYFDGKLVDRGRIYENSMIRLNVIKKYFYFLRKIGYAHCYYSHTANFNIVENEDGLYEPKYYSRLYHKYLDKNDIEKEMYVPDVQVTDQIKFSELVHELLSSDLMQLEAGHFSNNYRIIDLDFDEAWISFANFLRGGNSFIAWNGRKDTFEYEMSKYNSSTLINDMLSSEISADNISPGWLSIFEKHEDVFGKEVFFDVDKNIILKNGTLQIADIEQTDNYNVVKLRKKTINRK